MPHQIVLKMNSAEHKTEAERLVARSEKALSFDGQRNLLLQAQVHATLATIPDEHTVKGDLGPM